MPQIRVTSPDGRTQDFDSTGMDSDQIKARATLIEADLARGAASPAESAPPPDAAQNWAQRGAAMIPKVGSWIGGAGGQAMLGPLLGSDTGRAIGEAVGGSLPGTPAGVGATAASLASGPLGLGFKAATALTGLGAGLGSVAAGESPWGPAALAAAVEGGARGVVGGIRKIAEFMTAPAARKAVLPELQTFVAKLFGKANMVDEAGTPVAQLTQHAAARAAGRELGPFGTQELLAGAEGQRVASAMWRTGTKEVETLLGDTPVPAGMVKALQERLETLKLVDAPRSVTAPGLPAARELHAPATPIRGGVAQPVLSDVGPAGASNPYGIPASPGRAPGPLDALLIPTGGGVTPGSVSNVGAYLPPTPPAPVPPPTIMGARQVLSVIDAAESALTHGTVPQAERAGLRGLVDAAHEELLGTLRGGVARAVPKSPESDLLQQAYSTYDQTRRRYAQQMGLREAVADAWTGKTAGAFDPNIPRAQLMDPEVRTRLGKRFFPDPTRPGVDPVMVSKGKALYDELLDIFHAGEHTGAGRQPFVEGHFGLGGSFGSTGMARAFPSFRLPRSPRGPANSPVYTTIPRGLLGPPAQGLTNPAPE